MKLVESWVEISKDPKTSNAQKGEHFERHIMEQFHMVIGCGEYRIKDHCDKISQNDQNN